jgi:hypothetical protein
MNTTTLALVFVVASTVPAAHAQTSVDPTGHWKGTIDISTGPVDFEMDLGRNPRGELIGTLTAGTDHITLPLLKVAVEGSTMVFYGRTDQQFHAEVQSGGKALSGTATASGYTLPFSMGRTGDAKIDPPLLSPAVSKQLAGVWNGTLSASGRSLHLAVTIVNQPDGTAIANSVSVDEGGLSVPAVVSQSGRHVTIETRGVVTSFTGTLNDAGTELSGTWSQAAISLPLTLMRATVEGTR